MRNAIIIALAMTAITGCTGKSSNDTEKPIITVTIEPQRFFTEAIAGDKFNVSCMVPAGSSPESYDPTPKQMLNLSKSRAYLRIGYIGFEQTWMEKLKGNAPDMEVFDTSKGIQLIANCGHYHGEGESTEEHHSHNGVEPHVWNSTRNAIIIARNTLDALMTIDSANSDYYKERYEKLCNEIFSADTTIVKLLPQDETVTFMIYHPALSYYARDYGMKQISIEKDGKTPSPAHMKNLVEECRKEHVKVIFVQPEFDSRNAEVISQETGLKVVPINPLNADWRNEMINVAQALHDADEDSK